MKKALLIFFAIFSLQSFSQDLIQGKLVLEDLSSTKISVKNKRSNEVLETDWRGIFKMNMKLNDTLIFFQKEILFDEMIISENILKAKSFRLVLKASGTVLKDLVIEKGPIMNFGGKKLTKAEKLVHQNSIKPVFNNGIGVSTDGIFNRISGRSKIIKKVKSIEDNERDFNAFHEIYTDKILVEKINIPQNQITAFIYYIVDREYFNKGIISLDEKYQTFLRGQYLQFKEEYEL